MLIGDIEVNHPAVEDIMQEFDIIWPKIVWFDPNLEDYRDLIRSVYAHGMMATLETVSELKKQTIH
tara:strand:- start:315 stop:512 length:198 start_codon:yes stop_codon:yes gene_type:complete